MQGPDVPSSTARAERTHYDEFRFRWEVAMQMLGSVAFGVMTIVNLIVLGFVLSGLLRGRR
jgi:hypothetical protein